MSGDSARTASQDVDAPRGADHLRQPVARSVGGVRPFGHEDAGSGSPADRRSHGVDPRGHPRRDCGAPVGNAELLAEGSDGLDDLGERVRVHGVHLHAERAGRGQISAGDRTDVADVLGDDDVRPQLLHQGRIHRIEGATLGRGRGHEFVDLSGAHRREVGAVARHQGLVAHLRRPVAVLRHADERVDEAEFVDDVGCARQE
jgi:hypothetical protein